MTIRWLALVLSLPLVSVAGCQPSLDEGRYTCHFDEDCPSGWICRDDAFCWKTAIPPGPTRGDVTPLGGSRASGNLVLKDDGFDVSDRVCDTSGALCASGALGR